MMRFWLTTNFLIQSTISQYGLQVAGIEELLNEFWDLRVVDIKISVLCIKLLVVCTN
ncbi:hypothetical protein SAMN04488029_1040 [Reichenbachiella faecimaris]|uniref:Uncharacterized protein n=1 Tax=Reichenbachiella faecimaris TaxID=692418 RepID=A0A1W2G7M8_REIFA|nr:hypothetical protein SAMN04488029_1040 [Reichenbachiella faecimaris]